MDWRQDEQSLKILCDSNKIYSFHVIGDPENNRKEFRTKIFEEIMAENNSSLVKDTNLQAEESEQTSNALRVC